MSTPELNAFIIENDKLKKENASLLIQLEAQKLREKCEPSFTLDHQIYFDSIMNKVSAEFEKKSHIGKITFIGYPLDWYFVEKLSKTLKCKFSTKIWTIKNNGYEMTIYWESESKKDDFFSTITDAIH